MAFYHQKILLVSFSSLVYCICMLHTIALFLFYLLQITTDASVPSTSLADAFKRFTKHEDSIEAGNVGHAQSGKTGASSSKLHFLSRISSAK